MQKGKLSLLIGMILIILLSCNDEKKVVDLILINASIQTVNDSMQVFESIVVKDGKIIDLGTSEEMLKKYNGNISDQKDKFIYPGFIDAHCHFYGYAINKELYCDLRGSISMVEVIHRLKKFNLEHPENTWLLGRGWDQNLWDDKSLPDNYLLNKEFQDKPVVITRIDGHALVANDAALKAGGFDVQSEVKGIKIIKKLNVNRGLLMENAADSMRNAIPQFDADLIRKALLHAQHECFMVGLTSLHEAGLDKKEIELLLEMQKMDALKINIYAMLNPTEENIEFYLIKGPLKSERFHIECLKLYADGALGSRGACMLLPYSDDTGRGMVLYSQSRFDSLLSLAYKNNFQVATHAIGDSAVRFVLNSYAKILKSKNDRRWRIEHSQVVDSTDFLKYAEYCIIPVVNTTHATSDMNWAGLRLGDLRLKNAYAYKKLMEQNGWLANGSDFPVEEINPLLGFYSAVFRQNSENKSVKPFNPENALSREAALKAMTIWAAKAAFEDKYKGSLEKGKNADFVILNEDLLNVSQKNFKNIKVEATFVQGEQVF